MIKALYVERSTGKQVYAIDAAEAIKYMQAAGIAVEAVKEIGTDKWHETKEAAASNHTSDGKPHQNTTNRAA